MEEKIITGRYADISKRLYAVRLFYELGSKEFATQADVSFKSYSQWESGQFRISVDGAMRLRDRYAISLDFIFCGSLDTLPMKMANALGSSPLVNTNSKSTVNPET